MEQERYVWLLDPKVLDYFKFAEFSWWQVVLFFAAFGAVGAYFLFGVLLHRYSLTRHRRRKDAERLERWLTAAELSEEELERLHEMAGDRRAPAVYRLLNDPARFERRVQEAYRAGHFPGFSERLRDLLGYHSQNPRIRVVSTRQLQAGEHFRFAVTASGRPRHFYGQLVRGGVDGFTVEVTEDGFAAIRENPTETELFFLRANDQEYRFPLSILGAEERLHRLHLAHGLVASGHRPRGFRLPMVRVMTFAVRTEVAGEDFSAPALEQVPAHTARGVLLDLSEGGFSLLLAELFPAGCYVSFTLTLPRERKLPILGRALEVRPFAGNRFLLRCELKGVSHEARNVLYQVLHMEQRRRLLQRRLLRRGKPG